ncbi:SpaH/EbpB family LPXTG-anchored major pilin [Georgenia sp. Marseille-Q6866]
MPKRLRAALALTVAALVVPGLAVTASATAAAPPSNIDVARNGELTITAQARVAENAQPILIDGVTFTIERVTAYDGKQVDLTTAAGWEAVEDIHVDDVSGDLATRVAAGSATTGADGKAVFTNLELGLYYVTETGHRPDVAARTAPFLVTIPYPDDDVVGGWLYEVDVVPKSSVVTADKTVDDASAVTLGDRVTWTITGSVPQAATAGQPLSRYVVTDTLDPRLTYVVDTFRVTTQPTDVGLRDTEDYSGGFDPSTRTATIAFTASGLAKLATIAGPTATLSLSGETTVVEIGDGTIENTAELLIGDARLTATAVSEWGSLEIYKYAEGDDDASLAGAVFQAFASADDAKEGTNPLELVVNGSPVSTFTTGTDGTVLLPGFRAGTTVHLVEIEAPAGYTAAGTIEPVTITTGENRVEIANAQRDGVTLPVLGAQGMALAGFLGLGLMGGGAGLAVASKRRKARAHS